MQDVRQLVECGPGNRERLPCNAGRVEVLDSKYLHAAIVLCSTKYFFKQRSAVRRLYAIRVHNGFTILYEWTDP